MNERERDLRGKVAENLRLAEQLGQRVARIRALFEAKLGEHPLTIWSPIWGDLGRREILGYEMVKIADRYEFQQNEKIVTGRYDLIVSSQDSDLANSSLDVFGTIDGYGYMEYWLPPISHVGRLSRQEMENLLSRINYLESLLKLIGMLPDEEDQLTCKARPCRLVDGGVGVW